MPHLGGPRKPQVPLFTEISSNSSNLNHFFERCDCAQQLRLALRHIAENKQGIVIYLPQEGRGIGLANKIAVYAQQEKVFLSFPGILYHFILFHFRLKTYFEVSGGVPFQLAL